jgi:hypothetical protein
MSEDAVIRSVGRGASRRMEAPRQSRVRAVIDQYSQMPRDKQRYRFLPTSYLWTLFSLDDSVPTRDYAGISTCPTSTRTVTISGLLAAVMPAWTSTEPLTDQQRKIVLSAGPK